MSVKIFVIPDGPHAAIRRVVPRAVVAEPAASFRVNNMHEIPKIAAAIKLTMLDRAIMALDPRRGSNRLRARTMMAAAGSCLSP
jgi:hypothetical protein